MISEQWIEMDVEENCCPWFKVKSQNLLGGTEEIHQQSQSGLPVYGSRSDSWIITTRLGTFHDFEFFLRATENVVQTPWIKLMTSALFWSMSVHLGETVIRIMKLHCTNSVQERGLPVFTKLTSTEVRVGDSSSPRLLKLLLKKTADHNYSSPSRV
jgi:hypothetical protein